MKNINNRKIIAFLFISVLIVFFLLTETRIVIKSLKMENQTSEQGQTGLVDRVNIYKSKIENTYKSNSIVERIKFVELNGLLQKKLGKKIIDDVDLSHTIIMDDAGALHFDLTYEPLDMSEQVDSTIEIYKYCRDKDMEFLYVQVPSKVTGEEGQLPKGILDFSNQAADTLVTALVEKSVPVLDLRKDFYENGITYQNYFYRTDHHWNVEGAFLGYQKIVKYLMSNMKLDVGDVQVTTDKNNYDKITYPCMFAGSQGVRVGKYYAGVDDFSLYIPKFDTKFNYEQITNSEVSKKRNGILKEALLDWEFLDVNGVYTDPHSIFLGGNNESRIINENTKTDTDVLLIKDSFALPVATYLSLNVNETRLIDLRTYHGNVYDYIDEYKPDIVIVLYNTAILKEKEMFQFTGKLIE